MAGVAFIVVDLCARRGLRKDFLRFTASRFTLECFVQTAHLAAHLRAAFSGARVDASSDPAAKSAALTAPG